MSMVQRGSYVFFLAIILGVLWPALARTETGQIGVAFLKSVQGPQAENSVEIFPGDSFEAAVEALNPGETLIVHEGTYQDSGRLSIQVKGTPTAPVIIQKAPGEARPLITRSVNASVQNTINIEGATYLTLSGLEIAGNGGDGVNMNSNPSYITLEDLDIHDVSVGVNFRSSMDHITVRNNHIHRIGEGGDTGEGMYVGCNDATCAVTDSLIEGNWIHDTLGASQGDGIEIKRGSHSNIIRDNVIHDTHYPCILLYGTEGNPRNLVEGNVMWNCGDSGIQVAADAIIRNNIILESPNNGLNSQDHQGVTPNNIEFIHNTIVGGDPCLRMNNWGDKTGMVFANNAIYCASNNFKISGLSGVTVRGNVIVPTISQLPIGGYQVGRSAQQDYMDAAGRDLYPTPDSPLLDAGDPAHTTALDFNHSPRTGSPEAGAYTWTASSNPGWRVQPGFKTVNNLSPDTNSPTAPKDLIFGISMFDRMF